MEALSIVILVCNAPLKIGVWIVGLIAGNLWDGLYRGWLGEKPFGEI